MRIGPRETLLPARLSSFRGVISAMGSAPPSGAHPASVNYGTTSSGDQLRRFGKVPAYELAPRRVFGDPSFRACLSDVLKQSGFVVHQASSVSEGVEAVRDYDPVIITMDVDLPGFDGFEAARRIRTFSDAYLIMITGLIAEEDVLLGLAAGADDYLGKPFRAHELRARIGAMLRRPRTQLAKMPSMA